MLRFIRSKIDELNYNLDLMHNRHIKCIEYKSPKEEFFYFLP